MGPSPIADGTTTAQYWTFKAGLTGYLRSINFGTYAPGFFTTTCTVKLYSTSGNTAAGQPIGTLIDQVTLASVSFGNTYPFDSVTFTGWSSAALLNPGSYYLISYTCSNANGTPYFLSPLPSYTQNLGYTTQDFGTYNTGTNQFSTSVAQSTSYTALTVAIDPLTGTFFFCFAHDH